MCAQEHHHPAISAVTKRVWVDLTKRLPVCVLLRRSRPVSEYHLKSFGNRRPELGSERRISTIELDAVYAPC